MVSIFLINTGLEAGDHACRQHEAVSTAFFISPFQPVAVDEFSEFLPECAYAMMFFLVRDVPGDLIHVRFRDRKRSVASAPGEFSRDNVV
jgi:hypothetical protein